MLGLKFDPILPVLDSRPTTKSPGSFSQHRALCVVCKDQTTYVAKYEHVNRRRRS